MCGIAGILSLDGRGPSEAGLQQMLGPLACRGPDSNGISVEGPCALGHTRLSILDGPGGRQPMQAPGCQACRDLTVIFNGEIYNHRALRRQLASSGHRFASDHSDTEVLLHGFQEWAEELPRHLEGMFALAIWNRRTQSLFLARDRAGKKPLYLYQVPGQLLLASTEAGLRAGLERSPALNRRALAHYLALGYTGRESLWENIREMEPASWMSITCDPTRVKSGSYWSAPLPADTAPEEVDSFLPLLRQAVADRLEADVPLGSFLSGGTDSSLITALAQEHLKAKGQRIKTFNVAMPDARYDEGPWARRVADHLGTEHHQLMAQPNLEEDLRHLTATMGQPLGDSSLLPTYWVSKAAREHVTVALSGDGGDELFVGYDRYRALAILARSRRLLQWMPLIQGPAKSLRSRLGRLAAAARHREASDQYLSMVRLFGPGDLEGLGWKDLALSGLENWPPNLEPVAAARLWDFHNYLPMDLLRKVDRASMAVGLEVRCPLLDRRICESALGLPTALHHRKRILRQCVGRYLPQAVAARSKMGFAIPIGQWFAGPLKTMLQHHLLECPALTNLGCRRQGLETLIESHASGTCHHAQRLFALLGLAMWLEPIS